MPSASRSDAAVVHSACCEQRPAFNNSEIAKASANSLNVDGVGASSDNSATNVNAEVFRIRNLSDHHRRKYLNTRDNVALVPTTSLERFKESFAKSSAPDRLKQRFTTFSVTTSSGRPPDLGGDAPP